MHALLRMQLSRNSVMSQTKRGRAFFGASTLLVHLFNCASYSSACCQTNFILQKDLLTMGRSFCMQPKRVSKNAHSFMSVKILTYASIADTTPEPTVLPPSRIAKRRPSSIAIGVISSTEIVTLSPGIHISVPAGSSITPVTSVVLK